MPGQRSAQPYLDDAELVSITELLSREPTPNADEAVAVARALMRDRSSATPAVADVALFLRRLLPIGTAGVPGALHYTIARALREVEAPPFDSVEDFSDALARFEHGDSAQLMRGLLERAQGSLTAARPARTWTRPVAAWVTAAATLIFSGEAIHRWLAVPAPAPPAAREAQPRDVVLDAPVGDERMVSEPQPMPRRMTRMARRVPVKTILRRGSRSQPRGDRGLFGRLHLQWLRKAFTRRT